MKWFLTLIMLGAIMLSAQIPYQLPPDEITEIFNRQRPPSVDYMPKTGKLIIFDRESYVPLNLLALEKFELGGIEITPRNRARVRGSYLKNPRILDIETGETTELGLDGFFGGASFSPDERYVVINQYEPDRITVWLWDSKTGDVGKIYTGRPNQAFSSDFIWLPDNENILLRTVPEGFSDEPAPPELPIGPIVFESSGEKSQNRTYTNLLKNEHDEDLFTFYGTTQLIKLNVRTGKIQRFGRADLIRWITPSPDGKYFLVRIVDKPYSWKVNYWGFPYKYELWDKKGNLIVTLTQQHSMENLPLGGVLPGLRYFFWHPYYPHRMLILEALDGGDPELEVPHRDRVLYRDYPEARQEYFKTRDRFSSLDCISQDQLVIYEYNRERRWRTGYYLDMETGDRHVFHDYSVAEKYRHPGSPVSTLDEHGFEVALRDGDSIFLYGNGYEEEGAFPFLDRVDLNTWETTRVWQSERDSYQQFRGFVGDDLTHLVYRNESPQNPPNYFLYSLEDHSSEQLTHFGDPFREVNRLEKRLIRYKRRDGLELDGMLYLPPDYEPGKRYPMVMTAYPEEFTGEDVAAQTVNRENRYAWLWGDSPLYLCLQGYVVLDDAKIAVIGDPETVNETLHRAGDIQRGGSRQLPRQPGNRRSGQGCGDGTQLRCFHGCKSPRTQRRLCRRNRQERCLQPHADALRIPERTQNPLGSARPLP